MNKRMVIKAPLIELRSLDSLVASPNNARTHSPAQIDQIAASIVEFGFVGAVMADDTGIIAGHGRVMAATKIYADGGLISLPDGTVLDPGTVPVINVNGWMPEQRRAYMLADNQLALNAGWDDAILRAEIEALLAVDFHLDVIGFDPQQIADMLAKPGGGATDPDDVPPEPEVPTSQLGDIWIMGQHRVMCGSSTNPDDVAIALGGQTIDLACCDPPYGISVVKHGENGRGKEFGSKPGRGKTGLGRVHGSTRKEIIESGTYAPIIGDGTTETAVAHYKLLADLKVPAIVLWGGNYFASEMPDSRCWLVWDKENTGSFADAELAWTNLDRVVRLFRHQWNGLIKASERGQRRVHPTQKPVALAEWVITTIAPDAKVMFDGFLGSGWTLIAAQTKGIACVATELAPAYVDVAVMRWQAFTNSAATLEGDGRTFDEIKAERCGQSAEAL